MATTPPTPFRAKYKAWMARRTRVGRLCLRLIAIIVVASTLRAAGVLTLLDEIVNIFCLIVLLPLLVVLFYRWVTQRLLWKVRNRLILTYLLMGLSPVVLFGTLGGIAAYLLAGQYATNSALSVIDRETTRIKDEAASQAAYTTAAGQKAGSSPATQHPGNPAGSKISISVLDGSTWRPLGAPADAAPTLPPANPSWLKPPFRGVVAENGQLFLCSVSTVEMAGKPVVLLGSMPLDDNELGEVASGLGIVRISPGFTKLAAGKDEPPDPDDTDTKTHRSPARPRTSRPKSSSGKAARPSTR